jgi:vacuolar protein sorting-associated protein 26
MNMAKELEPPGELTKNMNYNFSFKKVGLNYETYEGAFIIVRYFIRVTITKKIFSSKLAVDKLFHVYNVTAEPELNANVRMEVGMSNLIHLEYEIFQNKFSLKDCILGKIYFSYVNLKVKSVELHLIRKENIILSSGPKADNFLISKFEVVDGKPDAGELVPIRMFLNCYDLSPTYKDINGNVSVKYYLKFVVIDDDDKAFFKQQEIILWRQHF